MKARLIPRIRVCDGQPLVEIRRPPSERWLTLVPPSGMFGRMEEAQKAKSVIRETGSLPAGWKVLDS